MRIGVEPGAWSAPDLFAALRTGRTCSAQGHRLDLVNFRVDNAPIGTAWQGGPGQLYIALDAHEDLGQIELIGCLRADDETAILHSFGPQPTRRIELSYAIPAHARGFVRLRISAASRQRPAPGPDGPKLFQTSAILLDA